MNSLFKLLLLLELCITFVNGVKTYSDFPYKEGFEDISTNGWTYIARSNPMGSSNPVFQGDTDEGINSYEGSANSYAAVDSNNGAGTATISTWIISPEIENIRGISFSFYTISKGDNIADRLQVRYSTNGASTDVGNDHTTVGDFTELLADINQAQSATGYPTTWTKYTYSVPPAAGNARIAFRYYVTDGGPFGDNSYYLGIDSFEATNRDITSGFTTGITSGVTTTPLTTGTCYIRKERCIYPPSSKQTKCYPISHLFNLLSFGYSATCVAKECTGLDKENCIVNNKDHKCVIDPVTNRVCVQMNACTKLVGSYKQSCITIYEISINGNLCSNVADIRVPNSRNAMDTSDCSY